MSVYCRGCGAPNYQYQKSPFCIGCESTQPTPYQLQQAYAKLAQSTRTTGAIGGSGLSSYSPAQSTCRLCHVPIPQSSNNILGMCNDCTNRVISQIGLATPSGSQSPPAYSFKTKTKCPVCKKTYNGSFYYEDTRCPHCEKEKGEKKKREKSAKLLESFLGFQMT